MTVGEWILWNRLRFGGFPYRFRRQYPAGPYVLDIYCPSCKLCIEIDGEFHLERQDRDLVRDQWLERNGVLTLRIRSWEVFEALESAVRRVAEACENRARGHR